LKYAVNAGAFTRTRLIVVTNKRFSNGREQYVSPAGNELNGNVETQHKNGLNTGQKAVSEIFARAQEGDFAEFDAAGANQPVRDFLYDVGFSAHDNDFEAIVGVDVNVSCRNNIFKVVMLKVAYPVVKVARMVVEHHADRSHDFARNIFPFVRGESVTDQIPDRFGAVSVLFRFDVRIKFFEQISRH